MLGILCSKTLRATDIRFLNDYQEFEMGFNHIIDILKERINSNFHKDEKLNDSIKNIYIVLQKFIYEDLETRRSYITSFTDKKDNLRQWMAYGKANASYCIGFKAEIFDLFKKKHRRMREFAYHFKPVSYDGNKVAQHILEPKTLLSELNKLLENGKNRQEASKKAADLIINELMFSVCSVKPGQFIDESESRLIFQTRCPDVHPKKINFSERSGIVVPHIDISFDYDWIEEIIIGPNIQKELAEKGLKSLLESKEINCKITHTQCTLRQF